MTINYFSNKEMHFKISHHVSVKYFKYLISRVLLFFFLGIQSCIHLTTFFYNYNLVSILLPHSPFLENKIMRT